MSDRRIRISQKQDPDSFSAPSGAAPLVFQHAFPFPIFGPDAMDMIVKGIVRARDDWLAAEMAKVMPPELFLRAYGNLDCKRDVARWLMENGYVIKIHPDQRYELWHADQLLSTFLLPMIK